MSMTQIIFLNKNQIPNSKQIETGIQEIGYNFKFVEEFEFLFDVDGITCEINGHETYIELYAETAEEVLVELKWIEPDISDQDFAISFIWGADYAAGASIGLISIALIDLADALSYYIDDEIKYTRQMLIDETPQYLKMLENKKVSNKTSENKISDNNSLSIIERIKKWFR